MKTIYLIINGHRNAIAAFTERNDAFDDASSRNTDLSGWPVNAGLVYSVTEIPCNHSRSSLAKYVTQEYGAVNQEIESIAAPKVAPRSKKKKALRKKKK